MKRLIVILIALTLAGCATIDPNELFMSRAEYIAQEKALCQNEHQTSCIVIDKCSYNGCILIIQPLIIGF